MSTNTKVDTRTSDERLMSEVYKLCDAGGSVIQIRTREAVRCALTLRKSLLSESQYTHVEWDIVNGFRTWGLDEYTDHFKSGGGEDPHPALMQPLLDIRTLTSKVNTSPDKIHCYVYIDAHPYIRDNPILSELLQQYSAMLPARNVCIILVTPDTDLGLPMGTVLITDMPTPNIDELSGALNTLVTNVADTGDWAQAPDLGEEDVERIAALGLGMTRSEFDTHVSLAIVQAGLDEKDVITAEDIEIGVAEGKTEVVKQSDILELFPAQHMSDVGGMQRLKDWVIDRTDNFSPEAAEFGIEPPKGIAIVGVPGGGKSLIAKAVAGEWGVPLIRLDFGNVFSKFIGDSESRMRSALNMVSSMGRLVLFADEIDKGLGGIGGGGDSGVSSRVLGAFLTWMQENRSNVFVIMTANRIEGLPPELFRRGRLDAVFSVGLPSPEERQEVLAVHLAKRDRSIKAFTASDLAKFAAKSEGYLPAEIESAVKDGLVLAYNDKKKDDLEMSHILESLETMVPMSISHKTQIDKILEWAAQNATPVNYPPKSITAPKAGDTSRRVARAPARKTLN